MLWGPPAAAAADAAADDEEINKVIEQLSGKNIDELIQQGKEKLAAVPGGAAPAGGAAAGAGGHGYGGRCIGGYLESVK